MSERSGPPSPGALLALLLLALPAHADSFDLNPDGDLDLLLTPSPAPEQTEVDEETLYWPAEALLMSDYGWRRHPRFGDMRLHKGIDLAGDPGTPIYAMDDGVVLKAEYNPSFGRMVVLDHGDGATTLYAHCRKLLVEVGEEVAAGAWIAEMGATGRTTGPHLHFEIHHDDVAVDPLEVLPPRPEAPEAHEEDGES